MNKENSRQQAALWIFFGFLMWIFTFQGFLLSKLSLIEDATSYYAHTKFFIENLAKGVFPLWDPYWFSGVPNDFFLRRIGAFNPFYLSILLFKFLGISYTSSYLWFLAIYYWSGMVAFYLLAMRIYQNRLLAYAGYLILLFSALGTRLFDSYMMLVTIPLIWFFYFLVAFSQSYKKQFFLGLILSSMLLLGTYIPFYFLIILFLFLVIFLLVYASKVPVIISNYIEFVKKNVILVILSVFFLCFSILPLVSFFHDSTQGNVALPLRHGNAVSSHVLTVPTRTLDWGVLEDLMYSAYFSDLRVFKFAVVYVPFFSIIVLFLGFIGRINKRAVFIFLLGMGLFCSIIPHGLPFYDFFYQHIFFLKYFRNLHFFIWFFLIPLFVFLVLEHWDMFNTFNFNNNRNTKASLIYVFIVHLFCLIFVYWRGDAVLSTYIMIGLSLIFWFLAVLNRLRANGYGFLLLTAVVLAQPLEAYHYFSLKAMPHTEIYDYNFSFNTFNLVNPSFKLASIPKEKGTLYYVSKGYGAVYQDISTPAIAKYVQNKLILVDHLKQINNNVPSPILENIFLNEKNLALVYPGTNQQIREESNDPHPPAKAIVIDEQTKRFKFLGFDANHLRFSIEIPYDKFLIYNDCFDPDWHMTVNNRPADIYETNGAFKGAWIPAGKNTIEFCYGSWWKYTMNIGLSILSFVLLAAICFFSLI